MKTNTYILASIFQEIIGALHFTFRQANYDKGNRNTEKTLIFRT